MSHVAMSPKGYHVPIGGVCVILKIDRYIADNLLVESSLQAYIAHTTDSGE